MAAETFPGCWPSSSTSRPQSVVIRVGQSLFTGLGSVTHKTESFIHEWTPFLLVTLYFMFSICLYLFCTERFIDMFWFFFLTANFYIAGSTVLEALMSIGPCREARLAVRKAHENNWVFPTPNNDLVFLDLLIVSTSDSEFLRDLPRSGCLPTQ